MRGGGINSRSFIQHCQALLTCLPPTDRGAERTYYLLRSGRRVPGDSCMLASSYFRSAPSPDPLWTDDPRGEGSSPAAEGCQVRRWRGRAGQDRTAWRLLQCSCLAASPALTGQGQDDTMTVLEVVRMPVPRSMC